PAQHVGRPALTQTLVWFGDQERGTEWFKRALSVGAPAQQSSSEILYLALQTMADHEFPHGRRYYTKAGYFRELGDEPIEIMLEALRSIPSAASQVELAYLGGAAARVPAAETAFGDRSAPFIMNLLGNWADAAE